jgi:hypothetical protein
VGNTESDAAKIVVDVRVGIPRHNHLALAKQKVDGNAGIIEPPPRLIGVG